METIVVDFSWEMFIYLCGGGGSLLSKKMPLGVCHGYFRMVHMHVSGCYVMLSLMGACLWSNTCWEHCMALAMAMGFVRILPCGSWRQSMRLLVVRWNICLWIILGLFLSSDVLYLVRGILQLIAVCFDVILWLQFWHFWQCLLDLLSIVHGQLGLGGCWCFWLIEGLVCRGCYVGARGGG